MGSYPGAVFILFGVLLIGGLVRVVCLIVALRGTAPKDRPAIIRALADLFRAQSFGQFGRARQRHGQDGSRR